MIFKWSNIAARDPAFLQWAINGLVTTFKPVGLETNTKKTQVMTCMAGTARRHQQHMAVRLTLALRQQFTVHGDVLKRVKVFQYLGVGQGCGRRMHPHESAHALPRQKRDSKVNVELKIKSMKNENYE